MLEYTEHAKYIGTVPQLNESNAHQNDGIMRLREHLKFCKI